MISSTQSVILSNVTARRSQVAKSEDAAEVPKTVARKSKKAASTAKKGKGRMMEVVLRPGPKKGKVFKSVSVIATTDEEDGNTDIVAPVAPAAAQPSSPTQVDRILDDVTDVEMSEPPSSSLPTVASFPPLLPLIAPPSVSKAKKRPTTSRAKTAASSSSVPPPPSHPPIAPAPLKSGIPKKVRPSDTQSTKAPVASSSVEPVPMEQDTPPTAPKPTKKTKNSSVAPPPAASPSPALPPPAPVISQPTSEPAAKRQKRKRGADAPATTTPQVSVPPASIPSSAVPSRAASQSQDSEGGLLQWSFGDQGRAIVQDVQQQSSRKRARSHEDSPSILGMQSNSQSGSSRAGERQLPPTIVEGPVSKSSFQRFL